MTISALTFLELTRIDRQTLDLWIAEEWLSPSSANDELHFSDGDLARARLIGSLIHDMEVNDHGVGVALHLLDQVHGLRAALAALLVVSAEV